MLLSPFLPAWAMTLHVSGTEAVNPGIFPLLILYFLDGLITRRVPFIRTFQLKASGLRALWNSLQTDDHKRRSPMLYPKRNVASPQGHPTIREPRLCPEL